MSNENPNLTASMTAAQADAIATAQRSTTQPVTDTYEDAKEGPVIVADAADQRHEAVIHAIENVASMLSILINEVRGLRNESNRGNR